MALTKQQQWDKIKNEPAMKYLKDDNEWKKFMREAQQFKIADIKVGTK